MNRDAAGVGPDLEFSEGITALVQVFICIPGGTKGMVVVLFHLEVKCTPYNHPS